MTSMGMAEFSIGKIARQKSAYSGIGVYFVNDVGGDSKFSIKSGGVTASGVLPIAKNHTISAGIHAAFTNRSADFSRVSFMNQWNGSEFDNSIDPGESTGIAYFSHLDAGVENSLLKIEVSVLSMQSDRRHWPFQNCRVQLKFGEPEQDLLNSTGLEQKNWQSSDLYKYWAVVLVHQFQG